MAQHTPGPWRVQDGFNTIYTTSCPETGTGITIAIAKASDHQCKSEEVAPNARLLAAAPALLAALEALADEAFINMRSGAGHLIDEARAAIAAAKGE